MKKSGFLTRQVQFNFWSTLLAISGLLAIYKDSFPEWKGYQIESRKMALELAQDELANENARIELLYSDKLVQIDRRIGELNDETRSLNHQSRIEVKVDEIAELVQVEYEASQQVSFAKSQLGAWRSSYEHAKNDEYALESAAENAREKYEHFFAKVQKLNPPADEAFAKLKAAKAELKEMEKGPADLVREREKIFSELQTWKDTVEEIHPSDIMRFAAASIRDIPLLDFIDPKYDLKQIVLYDYPDITGSAKVDRCTTCHVGVDNPQFDSEKVPTVFRTHPKLDLYVGPDSPHPVTKFGCTTCHRGRGYGTTFTLSAHSPDSEEQAKEWKKKYKWEAMHHWDFPMLPKSNMEAMCFDCHKQTGGYELSMARQVFEGRQIYERRGCHGCHKIEGVSNDMNKVGPTLRHLAQKLDPGWVPKWLAGPRNFYSKTAMPHPFGHAYPSETAHTEYLDHMVHEFGEDPFVEEREAMVKDEAVMIEAVSAYLFENHTDIDLPDPPEAQGDPERGRAIVAVHNCLGCHKVDQFDAPGQGYGPDLSKVGTKTNRRWLFNWLRNPKRYWPDGKMPDPRLTDDEANDVTSWLLTLKDEEFMAKSWVPEASEEDVVEVAVKFLRAKMSEGKAVAQVAEMTRDERLLSIGKEAVYRNGCFGCHEIPGFETMGPIGTALFGEGSKELELFDFGVHKFVHTPHSRHDWINQKVRQPKIFFLGKVISPYEQELRMPWFGFSDEDADKITTFVMAQTGKKIPAEYRYEPTGRAAVIARGRKIIERKNCTGCHKLGNGVQYAEVGEFDFRQELVWVDEPVYAKYDVNLPEGQITEIEQTSKPGEQDHVILAAEEWVDGAIIFGEDDYFGMDEVFGPEPVELTIGQSGDIHIPLRRPERLKVYGVGEGYIGRFYEEAALAPPIIRRNGAKTRPEWFFNFLKNITEVRNHIQVRMPQWDWTDEEASAVVAYFAALADDPFPYETEDIEPLGDVHRETSKNLFGLPGTEQYQTSLQCFSCHPAGDLKPTSPKSNWGPDLYLTRDRLQVEFVKSWLKYPSAWSPGTRMPAFFYDREGRDLDEVPPPTPAVGEIGATEAIHRLAEMLYYLPEIDEVKVAAAAAAEAQKIADAARAEQAEEDFDEGEDFEDDEDFMDEGDGFDDGGFDDGDGFDDDDGFDE